MLKTFLFQNSDDDELQELARKLKILEDEIDEKKRERGEEEVKTEVLRNTPLNSESEYKTEEGSEEGEMEDTLEPLPDITTTSINDDKNNNFDPSENDSERSERDELQVSEGEKSTATYTMGDRSADELVNDIKDDERKDEISDESPAEKKPLKNKKKQKQKPKEESSPRDEDPGEEEKPKSPLSKRNSEIPDSVRTEAKSSVQSPRKRRKKGKKKPLQESSNEIAPNKSLSKDGEPLDLVIDMYLKDFVDEK